MTPEEYISQIDALPTYQAGVCKIFSDYPDLRVDKESGIKLCSPIINQFVTDFDIVWDDVCTVHLFAWEYGQHVYADPPTFEVGFANPYGLGYRPYIDWEEHLNHFFINPDLIKEIRNLLKSKPPINY